VFRWSFLGCPTKLGTLESQLRTLQAALGLAAFRRYRDTLVDDMGNHPLENDAHNRMLCAMVEVQAILHFASQGYVISLIPRCAGTKKPDFKAQINGQATLVEVKYIRPPDKLEDFLLRWWQAQKEVGGPSLGPLPHLMFEWTPIESRDEMSADEIAHLGAFFTSVFRVPNRAQSIHSGRLDIRYQPDRSLPPTTTPLHVQARNSKARREGLFQKIQATLDTACAQLATPDATHHRVIYLGMNLAPDIDFLWPEDFCERLRDLCAQYERKGVEVIPKRVAYL
jgi:hypothetical protein